MLEHALDYAQRGWEVFAVDPATKAPMATVDPHFASQLGATTDEATIRDWWTRRPDALIGCRVPPGVVVLDIDPRHEGLATWAALKAANGGAMPVTRTSWSGRGDGGFHVWYAWTGEGKPTAKALDAWAQERGVGMQLTDRHGNPTRWTCGIDVLFHDWRFSILPPSPHPVTGKPYRWEEGRGPEREPVAMPGFMQALVWPADIVTDRPDRPAPAPGDGASIADWVTDSWSWHDVLTDWTCVQGDGDEDGSLWRHPDATTAHSASVSNGLLFVYSTSTALEPTAPGDVHGHTRFAAYAQLHHGGDLSAAGRAARKLRPADINDLPPGAPPTAAQVEEANDDADSLAEVDLLEWWDGAQQPAPTILEHVDRDGTTAGIFYEGEVNLLFGDSTAGKSWVALSAIVQAARAGRHSIILDLEDHAGSVTARLRVLGFTRDLVPLVHYFRPQVALGAIAVARFVELVKQYRAAIVVLDSLGEAFGVEGIEENSDSEVAPWLRRVARPLADAAPDDDPQGKGPAVLLIDHVTLARQNPLHSSGSKRKRAAVTGQSLLVEATVGLVKGRGGRLKLVCAKDRHGNYRQGEPIATWIMEPAPSSDINVDPTAPPKDAPMTWRVETIDPNAPPSDLTKMPTDEKRRWEASKVVAAVRTLTKAGTEHTVDNIVARIQADGWEHAKRSTVATWIKYAIEIGALREEAVGGNRRRFVILRDVADIPHPGLDGADDDA